MTQAGQTQNRALSDYTSRENSEQSSPMGKHKLQKGASDPLTKLTSALLRSTSDHNSASLFGGQKRELLYEQTMKDSDSVDDVVDDLVPAQDR